MVYEREEDVERFGRKYKKNVMYKEIRGYGGQCRVEDGRGRVDVV